MTPYAVIGDPVQHSLSPRIFQLFAQQTGCALDYQAITIKPWDLHYALTRFHEQGYHGLNVTAPLKEKAFLLMHACSEQAQKARAVNMIIFREDGTYYGDNSDGLGLIRDLCDRQQCVIQQRAILVLGAGGATRGILNRLLAESPLKLSIANRTAQKAQDLAAEYQKENYPVFSISWDDITTARYDMVIQTTSAGINQEAFLLPTDILNPGAYCYDLVYGKGHLPFLRWAQTAGAAVCSDGLGMLVEQAAAAFYLWRQKYVDTTLVMQQLRDVF